MDTTLFQSLEILTQAFICWSFFRLAFEPIAAVSSANEEELKIVRTYGSGCAAAMALLSPDTNLIYALFATIKMLTVLVAFFAFQRRGELIHSSTAYLDDRGEELYAFLESELQNFSLAKLTDIKIATDNSSFGFAFDCVIKTVRKIRLHSNKQSMCVLHRRLYGSRNGCERSRFCWSSSPRL